MGWCFATPLSQRVPHFRVPKNHHRMSRFTTHHAKNITQDAEEKRTIGRHFAHTSSNGYCVLRQPSGNKGGDLFQGILKGTALWRTLSKRSQNAQPQNEILCSKGAWGLCPQQADGRKCECVLTLALLAVFVCG